MQGMASMHQKKSQPALGELFLLAWADGFHESACEG